MSTTLLNHHMVTHDQWENFTQTDHNTWKLLFERQSLILQKRATREIISGLEELEICNKNSNQCIWSCLDMMKIENINFNHNPAIYATCIDEINKLQINKKYKLNLSNLLLKETYNNGFPVRNINKFKQEDVSEILEGNNTLMSKNNKEIDNNLLKSDNNLTLLIPCKEIDENTGNNSINTIINKDIFDNINSHNIKIQINDKNDM